MVSKKTFIITIAVICILFISILGAFYYYHVNEIEKMKEEKDQITLIQNQETTGLENIIVE